MIRIPFHLRPPPGRTLHSLVRTFSSTKLADLSGTQEKSTRQKINFHELKHPSKVPQRPHKSTIDGQSTPTRIPVDAQTVQLLERLSLVDLDSAEAHRTLEDAIEFASQILSVDTDGVEPLYTVLERERLTLREDRVSDGNIQQDVLRNARVTEEENFVGSKREMVGGKGIVGFRQLLEACRDSKFVARSIRRHQESPWRRGTHAGTAGTLSGGRRRPRGRAGGLSIQGGPNQQ
ncbi:glutamyl-tRNA(Gln) amidotransferase subunit C-4, mitochondrial-like [Culex pipiens pallens]|uniref:glutamyl-tRNA(Gln) amidotransferase subunit C-4, mitochondrial-like n=1 Tax=Culex pipiens pallens TaxID=42434 RepID=UPI0022AA796A|nr:glutamyl-tRNA(Gln) amidotransferase subunit C-4, mitochondrial-like [Culex pipiens pallens]